MIVTLLAKYDGFYSAWVAPEFYAEAYLNNCIYKIKTTPLNSSFPLKQDIDFNDIINFRRNKMCYLHYKLLSKITFGDKRQKYKEKKKVMKAKIKRVNQFLKAS